MEEYNYLLFVILATREEEIGKPAQSTRQQHYITTNKRLGGVARSCHHRYVGNINRKMVAGPDINVRSYFKSKRSEPWSKSGQEPA
jgi:hypothetical protein